ncbi:GntR family transcriptional regulator [Psychromarinibacter sp. C21-152]|uniref:GntR family transcriptional regulator n=1 Tax=Psychromarinibacter sediminicola TaxID=3033385 RepID=A0AAE3TC60_9RHOB|nr:GntR family transcriptional regulator [Psychromarinibacter sediminicola]MDF0603609.1 GntR family transcriptional regulator [Psychromarinibacter sediminicola]
MESLQPIKRASLHGTVVERLRDLITEGHVPPGEKINEKALCEAYGVSRTPLREALKVLASEGLVTLTPNRGATVAEITERDLDEVFPILMALEGLAGEAACARMSDAAIRQLRVLQDEMEGHYEAGDRAAYFQTNQAIHEAILEGCENQTLIATHRALAGRVRRARYLANMSPARWKQAVEEHAAILWAIEARDGARTAQLLREHLSNKRETLRG